MSSGLGRGTGMASAPAGSAASSRSRAAPSATAACCACFSQLAHDARARALYPLDVVRFLIYAMLVVGFGLGAL